ncbi:MAG: gluconokinase [Cyanobacteria bacterium P01_A01_bin.84]
MIILLMGVSGSGKTTVGKKLAQFLDCEFVDADHFHSQENVEKMRHGIPLGDADRIPWLKSLKTVIQQWITENKTVVLACSALKASYRQQFLLDSTTSKDIKLVYLQGSFELIRERLQQRQNHFMSEKLLRSQFDTLEEPLDAIVINISKSTEDIVTSIVKNIKTNTNSEEEPQIF